MRATLLLGLCACLLACSDTSPTSDGDAGDGDAGAEAATDGGDDGGGDAAAACVDDSAQPPSTCTVAGQYKVTESPRCACASFSGSITYFAQITVSGNVMTFDSLDPNVIRHYHVPLVGCEALGTYDDFIFKSSGFRAVQNGGCDWGTLTVGGLQ